MNGLAAAVLAAIDATYVNGQFVQVTRQRSVDTAALVTGLRHHLLRHRAMAMAIVFATLCMKLLVPAGFMPTMTDGVATIEICSGYGPDKITMTMPGMPEHHGKTGQTGAREMPCGFGGLSMPSLATVDPLLLAVASAFIVRLAWRIAEIPPLRIAAHLRPPLRGPPATT